MYTFWIVSYQLPFDLIVGIYKTEKEAKKRWNNISNHYAPIYYPCDDDMVKNQSGYRKYHDKIVEKLINN